MKRINDKPLDDYEKELKQMIENDELDYSNSQVDESLIKAIENFKEERRKKTISIRLTNKSLNSIKKFAKSQNIPYQTLINIHLNNFAESIES